MSNVDLLEARLHSIAIEVTSKCNLRCLYCHKADDVLEAMPGANDDMTDEMIGDLYRYCKEAGIKNVTLSVGGETTMFAGWHRRIAQFLDDPDMQTHMVSNFARVLSEEDLEALSKFHALQISFDSSELEMVRKLRSKADLRTITYNVIRLRQKGRELGRCPYLVVNCTCCRDNIGHVAKLAGFCRELGVDQMLLTEVMVISDNNPKMPQTLDSLTDDEVVLLAKQIIAAEEALQGSSTALRLQDHLEFRIGEVLEQVREGTSPVDAGAYFHRRMDSSACRQPWLSPLVGATGKVHACCGGETSHVGNVGTSTMHEIADGEAARAIRASILDGRPIVRCQTCSFAHRITFPEFARGIREWLGETTSTPYQSEAEQTCWPGLLGASDHPVVVENSQLRIGQEGAAALIENRPDGMHRVLIDIERGEYSTIRFRVRPAGRRRLRLDFAERTTMVGRSHIVLTHRPVADVAIGEMKCQVARATDGWYEIDAVLPTPTLISHINLSLMREDNAVNYPGDGRSGLDISNFSVGRSADALTDA